MNVRIRGWLRTGAILEDFFTIDAAIFYHAMREKYGRQDVCISGERVNVDYDADLPFRRVNPDSDRWFYACSSIQWDPVQWQDNWSKRVETGYIDKFTDFNGKVNVGSGRYRSYYMPIFPRHDGFAEWFAVTDDIDELRRLLQFVTNIGKKPSQGWGRVWKWDVDEIDEDWSMWKDGALMRPIPDDDSNVVYGIRSPGWLRSNQYPCRLP